MAGFPAAPTEGDPYRNFKFRLKWDGRDVAGFSRVSALPRQAEVVKHRPRTGAVSMHNAPGQTDHGPITLESGVTNDVAFEQWASTVWRQSQLHDPHAVSVVDFRRNLVLDMYNEAGQLVLTYNLFQCWPSELVAMPELDGSGDVTAIESLVLQHEGWTRDTSGQGPKEPSFTDPRGT